MKIFGMDFYKKATQAGFSSKTQWRIPPQNQKLLKELPKLTKFNPVFEASSLNPKVLILARHTAATGSLLAEIKKNKTPFVFINIDEFIYEGRVHVSENSYLQYKKQKINLKNIVSAYVDFSELLEVYHFKRQNFTAREQIFISRWLQILVSLESLIPNWAPCRPSELRFESQNKWKDSTLAKKIGMNIPRMILSNDVNEIHRFALNQKVIYKETGIHFYTNSKKEIFYFHADLLNKKKSSLKSYLKTSNKTPGLFQEFIEKKSDIRIFCIGNKVFAVDILSQDKKEFPVNWKGKEESLKFQEIKISSKLQNQVVQYRKHLQWQFLTLDFIRGNDGKIYFLEANRPGQWLYMELLANIPLTKEIARFLRAD